VNALFENLMPTDGTVSPDGFYLRDNSPFTISNGTELEIAKYVKNATKEDQQEHKEMDAKDGARATSEAPPSALQSAKRTVTRGLGAPPNPEDIGHYEGYQLRKD
jgi:hypothetical protein